MTTETHGVSFWADTGRIDVVLLDGKQQSYFIKVVSEGRGRNMVRGEFESMKAIRNITPEFAPAPIAWGSYSSIPDTHFLLCEFKEMWDEMPDPMKFGAALATLHQKSSSPHGKFGFGIDTYAGKLPQRVDWEDSWETFFAKSMRWALDLELTAKRPSEELDCLIPIRRPLRLCEDAGAKRQHPLGSARWAFAGFISVSCMNSCGNRQCGDGKSTSARWRDSSRLEEVKRFVYG